jgi:glycosyltransferase involved in cell wall biosynthesis
MTILYFYPKFHTISFKYVAEQYITMLSEFYKVETIDESVFHNFSLNTESDMILHPLLYIAGKDINRYITQVSRAKHVIGIDVADSDKLSVDAVTMSNLTDALIVPSNFSLGAYVESGVRVPIYVVPHALNDTFLSRDPPMEYINELGEYIPLLLKLREKYRVLFFYTLWHSEYRKGADLVFEVLSRLSKERNDFTLISRTGSPIFLYEIEKKGIKTLTITRHLSYASMRYLYDLCDIYPLFSRGGGFELNGLEALARNEIVIASEGGAWQDYLPREFLVPPQAWVRVFRDNPYHIGVGPEIDIEKAIDKLHTVMDNLDEYKAKAREYSEYVREKYSFENIKNIFILTIRNIIGE